MSSYNQHIEAQRVMFEVLVKDFKLDLKKHTFYLDSKGKTSETIRQQSLPILAAIKDKHPKLVFLSDDNALKFFGPQLAQQGITIVALGINANPRIYFNSEDFRNVYGVLERPLIIRGVIEINNLVGNKKNAIILFDDSHTSDVIINSIFNQRAMIKVSNINIKYRVVKNLNDIKLALNGINEANTHLFLGPMHSIKKSDANSDTMTIRQTLKHITDNHQSRYYSFWNDYIMPNGAHIAYGVDLIEHADIALNMAYQILNKRPTSLRFVTPSKGEVFQ